MMLLCWLLWVLVLCYPHPLWPSHKLPYSCQNYKNRLIKVMQLLVYCMIWFINCCILQLYNLFMMCITCTGGWCGLACEVTDIKSFCVWWAAEMERRHEVIVLEF